MLFHSLCSNASGIRLLPSRGTRMSLRCLTTMVHLQLPWTSGHLEAPEAKELIKTFSTSSCTSRCAFVQIWATANVKPMARRKVSRCTWRRVEYLRTELLNSRHCWMPQSCRIQHQSSRRHMVSCNNESLVHASWCNERDLQEYKYKLLSCKSLRKSWRFGRLVHGCVQQP